jgi:uncharacterized phage protein (TIGR02218 family)
MKTIDPALATHLAAGVTTLCRCWRVERKDGVVMGFTDHDRVLAFDGVTYQAASGFSASAIEDQLGLAVSNLDVEGALSSGAITEADLNAGRYDDAAITIFLVSWQDVSQRLILRSGYLGQVSRGTLAFNAELRGLAARLDQSAGRIFQRTCPWNLGDTHCGIDLNAPGRNGSGAVSQVFGAFDFATTGLGALAAGVFTRGRLVWTSGANDGLAVEVKSHSAAGATARISLFLPTPDPIQPGDTFTVTAGCDKRLETCRDRFSNVINFGGFPHIPGNDFALSYPNQGSGNNGGRLG